MKIIRRIAAALIVAGITTSSVEAVDAQVEPGLIVVNIGQNKGTAFYTVDGVRCTETGSAVVAELMRRLGTIYSGRGDIRTVAVVASAEVSIENFSLVEGIATKVGFQRVRFFLAHPSGNRIVEISFGNSFRIESQSGKTRLVQYGPN